MNIIIAWVKKAEGPFLGFGRFLEKKSTFLLVLSN